MRSMEISNEARATARRWSRHAEAFLDYAAAEPACHRRETFATLDDRERPIRGWKLQSWPALVGPEMQPEMEQAAVSLLRLNACLPERIFGNDPKRVADFYGLESEWLAQVILEAPNGIDNAPARTDFIETGATFKCLEVNCGSNIGGWQMTLHDERFLNIPVLARFFEQQGVEPRCRDSVSELFAHTVQATVASGDFQGPELNLAMTFRKIGIYGYRHQPIDAYRNAFARALAAHGLRGELLPCLVDDLEDRRGAVHAEGRLAHALLEQHEGPTPDFVFRAAKGRRLVLFTGPASRILSDKRNLALLSENSASEDLFSAEERTQIQRYVPWTRSIHPREVDWHGQRRDLGELLRAERGDLVLKIANQSAGSGIYLGRNTEAAQWNGLVKYALDNPGWLAQEYVRPAPWIFQEGPEETSQHDVVWGLLAWGGRYTGNVVRMQPRRHDAIINMAKGATIDIQFELDS